MYLAPHAAERAAQYTAVMVDQPEVFVHPDSRYKGIKPDDMKAIADALRAKVTDELRSGYRVVDQAGPNVLYVRFAVGDLMLQKKKRPVLAYTPVGALVDAARHSASEFTSKINLTNMKVEGEVLDSVSQEQLAAITASRGSLGSAADDGSKAVSWEELNRLFSITGKRLRCRLDNAHAPAGEQRKCGEIGLTRAGSGATATG